MGIPNIGTFLEQCPDRAHRLGHRKVVSADLEVLLDLRIHRIAEPISAIPIAQYTDELIVRQGLRVIYYMDRGQSGHLPWTTGTLYDWMKSRIAGINIVDGVVGGYCCARLCQNSGRHRKLGNELH